jgi:hypothetical protein
MSPLKLEQIWLVQVKLLKWHLKMGCWLNNCFKIQTSLLKIQISVVFLFRNDLNLVNNKNHTQTTLMIVKDGEQ